MKKKRNNHPAAFKAQVALAALKEDRSTSELASHFDIHPTLINAWRKQLLAGVEDLFARGVRVPAADAEAEKAQLFEQIGRLKVELDWLKKKRDLSLEQRRDLVEPGHPQLSVRRQCVLLGLPRSSYYYEPASETPENLRLMRLIDEQYLACPFYGSRRMAAWLREKGEAVNRKRTQRLMRLMGLEAIYPKPRLSAADRRQRVYPYLLRDVRIERVDQVWSADITYIPMVRGFMYLAATIDWHSRYVIAWRLSNTLESTFCLEMLQEALSRGRPEVFNTDQGVQFTAQEWTSRLLSAGVAVSMDGKGRCLDNVFVERLWRSLKYEDIYLKGYESVPALQAGLQAYWTFYNHERLHQSLAYRTPVQVYREGRSAA
jgi:putative transposase